VLTTLMSRREAMSKKGRPGEMKLTDPIPPGATREAFDEPLDPGGGPPGSGAGDRHMAGDTGPELAAGPDEPTYNDFSPTGEHEEEAVGYGGRAGGAVGGTPAGGRVRGGNLPPGEGLKPGGVHRGDSTVGADPSEETS
jgi:hypothetical protein